MFPIKANHSKGWDAKLESLTLQNLENGSQLPKDCCIKQLHDAAFLLGKAFFIGTQKSCWIKKEAYRETEDYAADFFSGSCFWCLSDSFFG